MQISQPRSFPHLEAAINEAIDEFGAVFPKLNWSSPKVFRWSINHRAYVYNPLGC